MRAASDRRFHGPEMHALGRGSLLDIAHVALQGLREVSHRARLILARQYPRVHNTGQRGAMGGAGSRAHNGRFVRIVIG
jgi:hypothetical protein